MSSTETLTLKISAGKAALKLLGKDINQIYLLGKRFVDEKDATRGPLFKAMFSRAETLLNEYLSSFKELQTHAILEEDEALFPTEEDIKARNDINLLYYSIVRCHQQSTSTTLAPVNPSTSQEIMTKFWEMEEVSHTPFEHPADRECENHFQQTHFRKPSGRYIVALPFKTNSVELGDSESPALIRFSHLETKLSKNLELRAKYQEFLQEYVDLQHMSPSTTPSKYVIPHHPVFKGNNPQSKIRVVFDASMPTRGGSLNDYLHVGPKLQKDIGEIIPNFRRHPIALTADIVKMYRQIEIIPEHRAYQHILWRPHNDLPVTTFELNTVTYGMTCSPFLALRTIQQLVLDKGQPFPLASKVLSSDLYVDDIVTGAATLSEALEVKDQLRELLGKGCFPVHKWASNSLEFMHSFEDNVREVSLSLSPKDSCCTKILGMVWDPGSDTFSYKLQPVVTLVTKRTMLSTIARLFDPMGFLAPVIFYAKALLQRLWLVTLDWDDPPDQSIVQDWNTFISHLPALSEIAIARRVIPDLTTHLDLVGFCDASQTGYSAVIYLRSVSATKQVSVSLLKAKTKLAPIKTLSIPRLELSAAHLLVKLLVSVQNFLESLQIQNIYLFSDATIVLSWLRIPPNQLQTFVANRISFILTHTSVSQWYHVPTESNPADVASRGILPNMLAQHPLWWNGPHWLYEPSLVLPSERTPPDTRLDLPELKPKNVLIIGSSGTWLVPWMERFSSYQKMIRTLAYVLRFKTNIFLPAAERCLTPLSLSEINQALKLCVGETQQLAFQHEFHWEENRPLSHRLQMLSAFKDKDGLLRVGGRLSNAPLPYNTRHPWLLPSNSHLVNILIDYYHHLYFHMGTKALQALIQRQFWAFKLRQTIKFRILKCLVCFKRKAIPANQFMGSLPASRVSPGRPFSSIGIDFGGPFAMKVSNRRNSPTGKAYLCIFVCMATKAAHLEPVSSLSTDAFLSALDRFVARRGVPQDIYSDCGTNFVGAARQLKALYGWLNSSDCQKSLAEDGTSRGIKWHFNPPSTPHFGGLWEAAIKSAKFHLYRVVGNTPLTFEEMSTLFTRVEAILNSRPLCPVSNDVDNLDYLSPGHFLIGAPLVAIPEQDITILPLNRLSRWQLVQNSNQHIWRRWQGEYVQTLQKRSKWCCPTRPFQVGDVVVLSDPSATPLNWRLARITKCFPGSDGFVRVVMVRTAQGTFKRPITKIALLPFPSNSEPQTLTQ